MKSVGKVAPNNNIVLAISWWWCQLAATKCHAKEHELLAMGLKLGTWLLLDSLTMSSTRYATNSTTKVFLAVVAWFMIAAVWQYYLTICHLSHKHTCSKRGRGARRQLLRLWLLYYELQKFIQPRLRASKRDLLKLLLGHFLVGDEHGHDFALILHTHTPPCHTNTHTPTCLSVYS